ncbi:hypothetical protein LPJ75_003329, partial [Coemansia sp. RSA 2598]
EVIGALSEYDLKRRPDLLIVIGTSLKIPGIKRMVKEMSRCVRDCSVRAKRAGAGKAIFINRDEPPRGWEDVFDIYVSGDSDQVIGLLPIRSAECPTDTSAAVSDAAADAELAEKASGGQKGALGAMSIENLCGPNVTTMAGSTYVQSDLDAQSKPAAKAQSRRRQLKKPVDTVSCLARNSRKAANVLIKKPSSSRSQQQQQRLQQQRPPRKLTSMLKVVKSGAAAETKRPKKMYASPQSPLGKLDIPTSPPIVSSSSI